MAPSRSHSPPLPPNATYNHPKIGLAILPSSRLFVAGGKVAGMMEVNCSSEKVALGEMALEFLGVEGAPEVFVSRAEVEAGSAWTGLADFACSTQSCARPTIRHRRLYTDLRCVCSKDPGDRRAMRSGGMRRRWVDIVILVPAPSLPADLTPPLLDYSALKGRTRFPFSFSLPSTLPSSVTFASNARVSYTLRATCQVASLPSGERSLVTKTVPVKIVERWADWDDKKWGEMVEDREEVKGERGGIVAQARVRRTLWWAGDASPGNGEVEVELKVRNSTDRDVRPPFECLLPCSCLSADLGRPGEPVPPPGSSSDERQDLAQDHRRRIRHRDASPRARVHLSCQHDRRQDRHRPVQVARGRGRLRHHGERVREG